jgi:hypothetical protein
LGIKGKIKHSRELLDDSNDSDEFTFFPGVEDDNDWRKLDNKQDFVQNKRNDDDNKSRRNGIIKNESNGFQNQEVYFNFKYFSICFYNISLFQGYILFWM